MLPAGLGYLQEPHQHPGAGGGGRCHTTAAEPDAPHAVLKGTGEPILFKFQSP